MEPGSPRALPKAPNPSLNCDGGVPQPIAAKTPEGGGLSAGLTGPPPGGTTRSG
jgi:hypothetical protein